VAEITMLRERKPPHSTGPAREAHALIDTIAGVLRLELDRVLVAADAPLVLPDSERWILIAVLSARVGRDSLPPIEGRHFGVGAWGTLWEASRETLDPGTLHMRVIEAGFPSVSTEIAEMSDYEGPLPSLFDLATMVKRIRDYWARRILYSELVACSRLLACEGLNCEEVFSRLRPIAKETRS
jgi:hypothetical protein